jgi:hypothetical protein
MQGTNITKWSEAKVRDYIARANASTALINKTARETGRPWIEVLQACSDEAEIIVAVWGAPLTRWGVEVGFVKGAALLDRERARAEVTGAKSVPLRTMYVWLENREFAMAHARLMGDDREKYPGLEKETRVH